jgi:N-acetylneuraminate synthase
MFSTPQSVYVIAEAGVNHDGSEARAFELVDIAISAGADAVKFQLFSPQALVTQHAACAQYQSQNLRDSGISQRQMLDNLTLPEDALARLHAYCGSKGIDFLCTPFDHRSLDYLVMQTPMRFMKLASGEVTNGPLLLAAARTGMPIILSTGMSTLDNIGMALSILHFGYTHPAGYPSGLAVATPDMLLGLREKVTLLHCVSQYPALISSINLLAMDTLEQTFALPVGLSDHSLGITMATAAAARGAVMIEKHFTHDVKASGPDHAASLSPDGLHAMVRAIREVSDGLGDGEKSCRPEERNTRDIARRSVVAAMPLRKGEVFSEANLICKRPATGEVQPNQLWQLLGRKAKSDYDADNFIKASELE